MIRKSKNVVWRLGSMDDMLGALSGGVPADPILDDVRVRLFGNDFSPEPDSILANFTVTDAVGYTAQTVAEWNGPLNPSAGMRGLSANATFVFGDNRPDGKTIYGYYITNALGTEWLVAERFEEEVNIVDPGDDLIINLAVAFPTVAPVEQ